MKHIASITKEIPTEFMVSKNQDQPKDTNKRQKELLRENRFAHLKSKDQEATCPDDCVLQKEHFYILFVLSENFFSSKSNL